MSIDHDTVVRILLRDRTKLLAYILSILRDEHAAEDILQEVSLAALRKTDEIRDPDHLMAWLRHVARLQSFELLRRQSVRPKLLDVAVLDLLEGHWTAADRHATSDHLDALRSCLATLTVYGSDLLKLRYSQGLSCNEIAQRLDRKLQTIYIALSRTRHQLEECVRQRLSARESGHE